MEIIKKPNLFVIGMPKTGTTSLYNYFDKHSDIFVPKNKEPNFFAKDLIDDRFKNKSVRNYFSITLENYENYFDNSENFKIVADMTPTYLYSKISAKEIYKYNPNAKIIALFREPVDFLYSLHGEFVYSLVETENEFFKALAMEKERKERNEHINLYYSEWIRYKDQLERYYKYFPEEQIKVIIYENFAKDNIAALDEIASFLNIRRFKNIDVKKSNTYKKNRLKFVKILVWKFPMTIKYIKKFLPDRLFKVITSIYLKMTTAKAKKTKLKNNDIKRLRKKFLRDVQEFEKFMKQHGQLSKDFDLLKFWGYDNL